MPRLNRVFQGAVDLATALKQGVLQTALDDMNFININLLTQEENARYEHRIFHCLQIFDILTLALAPPREDTLFGIACQKICDLPGLLIFDLPQTVQRQVEQTKLRNTRLIMDAIYICNNRRTMFLWSNKTSTGKGDYYYWLLHWSPSTPLDLVSATHIADFGQKKWGQQNLQICRF